MEELFFRAVWFEMMSLLTSMTGIQKILFVRVAKKSVFWSVDIFRQVMVLRLSL